MDVLKSKEDRKKSKTLNKKRSQGTKLNQTIKRKTTGRANHKAVNYDKGVHKFNEIRHVFKPILNKRLTAGRLKPKQNQEGIFLKGLRTQYVSRDSLNEARKNEDINKIIDLGGAMARKGFAAPNKSKRENADGKKFKLKELMPIFDVQNLNFDSSPDFERCPLSPISFDKKDTDTYDKEGCSQSIRLHKTQTRKSEIDFNEEFKKFAIQYEERVGTDILPKIPGSDILETTMKSLRRLYIRRKQELKEKEEADETQVFKFFSTYDETHNQMDLTLSHHKEMTDSFFTKGELPISEESPKFYPSLDPLSSNINFLENDHFPTTEFCSTTPFLHLFENGTISGPGNIDPTLESNLLPKEYSIPKREVNFVTPPIRFYPRNMF